VIALPPSLAGGVQFTVAENGPGVALTEVGAPGGVAAVGVTAFEAAESGPAPAPLIAVTLKV
jgi:hypothetical protein